MCFSNEIVGFALFYSRFMPWVVCCFCVCFAGISSAFGQENQPKVTKDKREARLDKKWSLTGWKLEKPFAHKPCDKP